MPDPISAFISWAHEDEAFQNLVLDFANRLCQDDISAMVDLFVAHQGPREGWPLWCELQVRQSSFVLVACTERLKRRYDGLEAPGVGLGCCWEALFVRNELYQQQGHNRRFIPIFLREQDRGQLPALLVGPSRYEVWQEDHYRRLCRHLKDQPEFVRPEVGSFAAVSLPSTAIEVAGPTPLGGAAPADEDTPVDREINDIMALAKSGKHTKAKQLLEDIRAIRWPALDDRLRFRVLANLGAIIAAEGDNEPAAALFRQAHAFQPHRRKAQVLLATADALEGDDVAAQLLATHLCAQQPNDPSSHGVRIRSAPPATSIEWLHSSVPEHLKNNGEILLALFNRAVSIPDFAAAGRFADLMVEADPNNPQVHLARGTVLLQSVLAQLKGDLSLAATRTERDQLEKAEESLNRAEQLWGEQDKGQFLASLYRNRATVRRFMGRDAESLADAKLAFETEPSDPDCSITYALELDMSGHQAEAVKVIDKAWSLAPDLRSRLLLAIKLHEQSSTGDANRAADLLFGGLGRLAELEERYRRDWLWILLIVLCELKDLDRAQEALAIAKHSGLPKLAIAPMESVVAHAMGDLAKEKDILDKALASATREDDHLDLQRLCDRLEVSNRYEEAFALYRVFCRLDRLTVHTRPMLQCALRAGELAFAMGALRDLRANGQTDAELLRIEGQISEQLREYENLAEVLKAGMLAQPRSVSWKLKLAHLAIDQRRPEWSPPEDDWIPSPVAASAEIGSMVASLLAKRGNRRDAAQYAYTLHRRFPDEPAPASMVIAAVFTPGRKPDEFPIPDRIAPGTAVRYTALSGQDSTTVVLENDGEPPPSRDRGELPPTHPLAVALVGRKVGEVFAEPGPFASRPSRVVGIFDKLVYRANMLASQWRQRHPDIPFVQEFRAGTPDSTSADPKAILGEVYQQLERQSEAIEHLQKLYLDQSVPLPMVAKKIGWTQLQATCNMIADRGGINCCFGTMEERDRAIRNLRSVGRTSGIVVEGTGLATLFLLDEADLLKRLPSKPMVAESSLRDLEESAVEPSGPDGEAARVGIEGGKIRMSVMQAPDISAWNSRISSFVRQVRENCTMLGGGDLAKLSKEKRELFQHALPSGTADSLAIAFARNALLWLDDLVLATILRNQDGRESIWTMAMCIGLEELDSLESERVARIGLRLLNSNYRFIGVSPAIVTRALADDLWDLSGPNADKALRRVVDKAVPIDFVVPFIGQVCSAIRRVSPSVPVTKHTWEFLVSLADARSDGAAIRMKLLSIADSVFGLDVVGAQLFKDVLKSSGPRPPRGPGGLILPN